MSVFDLLQKQGHGGSDFYKNPHFSQDRKGFKTSTVENISGLKHKSLPELTYKYADIKEAQSEIIR